MLTYTEIFSENEYKLNTFSKYDRQVAREII